MTPAPINTKLYLTVGPLVDSTDGKTIETGIAYNAAGMSVMLFKESLTGAVSATALTLTTGGGNNDWSHKGLGYYEVQISAAQNNTLGNLWVSGICDGVLVFSSTTVAVCPANVAGAFRGTQYLQVDQRQVNGAASPNPVLMTDALEARFPTPGTVPDIEQAINFLVQRQMDFNFDQSNQLVVMGYDGVSPAVVLDRRPPPDIGLTKPAP